MQQLAMFTGNCLTSFGTHKNPLRGSTSWRWCVSICFCFLDWGKGECVCVRPTTLAFELINFKKVTVKDGGRIL